MIMDSLRYWVTEMHVDGFRFDLAARWPASSTRCDRLSAFFDLVQQDPVVSQVKLIAEPWDVGEGGYQVGNFPPLWTEWNGKYRDTVRDFWRGQPGTLGEFAPRLTGSATCTPATAGARSASASTSSPATTASRCTTWSPTTTSTTRPTARTTGTAATTTGRGTAAPRARPTTRTVIALRERQQRNLLADPVALAGRADAARRRRDRPHAAGQQQRLLPGQRDLLGPLAGTAASNPGRGQADQARSDRPRKEQTRHCWSSPAGSSSSATNHPVFRRRRFFHGKAIRGVRRPAGGHRVVHPGRPGDDRRRLAGWLRQVADCLPERRRDQRTRTGAASRSATTPSCCCSTPANSTWSSPSRRPVTACYGRRSSTRRCRDLSPGRDHSQTGRPDHRAQPVGPSPAP